MSTLIVVEDGAIATVTIHRPDRLNALNAEVLEELAKLFQALERRASDHRPRVVVLTGAGDRAFVAGADISEMSGLSVAEARAFSERGQRLGRIMEESSFPIIAAVNGFALGGGCELALACDLIVASERARFGQPEVTLGLIPGFGGTLRLASRVGVPWARRLLFTGEIVDAQRAAELGLVDIVAAPEQLLNRAMELARSIADKAPLAVAASKRSLLRSQRADPTTALDHETLAFSSLFASADAQEGLQAFLAKRPPRFSGR